MRAVSNLTLQTCFDLQTNKLPPGKLLAGQLKNNTTCGGGEFGTSSAANQACGLSPKLTRLSCVS